MGTNDKCLKESYEYSAEDAKFMEMAINLSVDNIDTGGGPFGAVIVKNGEIIAIVSCLILTLPHMQKSWPSERHVPSWEHFS